MIQADLLRSLGNLLEDAAIPCDIMGADQKVYVEKSTFFYPDLIVVCGEPQFDPFSALRNPAAVVEVLSPSTERDDRTDKFIDYQKIESLHHYILIEQDRVAVTHYEKISGGLWAIVGTHITLSDSLKLRLQGKDVSVPLARIYRRVFTPDASNSE